MQLTWFFNFSHWKIQKTRENETTDLCADALHWVPEVSIQERDTGHFISSSPAPSSGRLHGRCWFAPQVHPCIKKKTALFFILVRKSLASGTYVINDSVKIFGSHRKPGKQHYLRSHGQGWKWWILCQSTQTILWFKQKLIFPFKSYGMCWVTIEVQVYTSVLQQATNTVVTF